MLEPGTEDLAACCASRRWVGALAGRAYADLGALRAASRRALDDLGWADVEEALAAHPRIGERAGGDTREAGWSRGEQSGMGGAALDVRHALVEGNRVYEERFGHVFLICASGRPAREMLGELLTRLGNDAETEREVVRGELAKIVDLRLAKLVEELT
ncbi:2-oxo-4-hydroxy-4-carboxy-5-ureidoimidazoline decarboxylase [Actinomadura madurae]|uniref:2-oxo-4-hydroxy-4-carboxy-5-ureidoimidazoline decarboxylase n=1 Tax=Actinomadura madurae TaxID=1993 RepID=UPI0020266248|nr:2-oxo-4-hydroxy-4-carboxy-5-ureidoimidazoline decarboxylase [Actinomadura madurae]URN10354.1 2-oxo-4-hydroxy-4-carboxy-5-ureidoimidazoline decarboxylase [Actinomadura madurae]